MKRFSKVYLEISNRCNLRCSFCPGTKRLSGSMDPDHFRAALEKLQAWTDFLYFHLMGEPLCHPNLEQYLDMAGEAGFRVILTTNGTLLSKHQKMLLSKPALHKINISLQSFEANAISMSMDEYLSQCFAFGKAAGGNKLVVYRLWNEGGLDSQNQTILRKMRNEFPEPWVKERKGTRIAQRTYLERGEKFEWPDLAAQEGGSHVFCYGLKDQIGVLWDGTVVPCCLDHEGDLALGNLFESELGEILESPRAKGIVEGFQHGVASEELCRKCGFARTKFG